MRKKNQSRLLVMIFTTLAVATVGVGFISISVAEEVDVGSADNLRLPAYKKPKGIKIGSYVLKSELRQGFGYTDNANEDDEDPLPDRFSYTEAGLRLKSDWKKHKLNFGISLDRRDYFENTQESRSKYKFSTSAEAELSKNTSLSGKFKYQLKSGPDVDNDDEFEKRHKTNASVELRHKIGKYQLTATSDILVRNYQDDETATGTIKDERSYTEYGLRLRGSYKANKKLRAFIEARLNKRVFQRRIDDGGNLRGSQGIGLFFGIRASIHPNLELEVALGRRFQKMKEPGFQNAEALVFDGFIQWKATKKTWLALEFETTLDETTTDSSSSSQIINRELRFIIQHNFTPKTGVKVKLELGRDIYLDNEDGRKEIYGNGSLEFYMTLNQYATLLLLLEHEKLFSNVPNEDIDTTTVSMAVNFNY